MATRVQSPAITNDVGSLKPESYVPYGTQPIVVVPSMTASSKGLIGFIIILILLVLLFYFVKPAWAMTTNPDGTVQYNWILIVIVSLIVALLIGGAVYALST
jgi:hypothetical protein